MITGPLIAKKNGTFILVGITSLGLECNKHNVEQMDLDMYQDSNEAFSEIDTKVDSDKNIFGAYTNVASYVKWIIQNSDFNGCQLSKYSHKKQANVMLRLLKRMTNIQN